MPTPHYFLYPFGQNADDLTAIPDAPAIDGSVSYYYGWTDPYEYNLLTNPAALPIPRGQMNQLFYDVTLNIQEYQQYGVPAWYSTISYPIYARVYYSNLVYENQVASNTATPGTDISWLVVSGNKVYYAQVTFQPTTQQVVASPGMSIIQFNSVITDSNNWWNAGTYLFTPTIPGKYRFSSVVHAEPASSSNQYVSL